MLHMRLVLALFAVAAASAQTAGDARSLLEAVSQAVRSAGSLRVEGVSVDDASRRETRFELIAQDPLLLRYHAETGPDSVLQVCDGVSRWNYRESHETYTRTSADEALCTPLVARWSDLTEHLASARITGRPGCEQIEATYTTGEVRTLCVDRARHIVVSEHSGAATFTYDRVEYNPPQPAETFQFQPPSGSSPGGVPLPLTGEGGADSYAGPAPGPGSSSPMAISTRQQEYTPEARQARLQGAVLIRLTVDEHGVPRSLKVVRGLGMGLDEKAIEAVSAWRFRPGTRAGEPAPAIAQVEVHFRLP